MANRNDMHAGHRERLRTRYMQNGLAGFADHEVMELLLTFAVPRGDTNPAGHALLAQFGSLNGVFDAHPSELSRVNGVGDRSALLLRLSGDIARRLALSGLANGATHRLNNAEQAARYALELVRGERYECVFVVSLDKHRNVLHASRLAVGTLTETPIYPRTVVETALLHHAHGVLLIHNHPSGDPRPSAQDESMTQAVQNALRSIDIQLFDHLIAGRQAVYSFARALVLTFSKQGMQACVPQDFSLSLRGVDTAPPLTPRIAAEKQT